MERTIDLFKEIIIAILIGLLVGGIGKIIGFLDGDCILPIIIGMVAGAVIDRYYKSVKKTKKSYQYNNVLKVAILN